MIEVHIFACTPHLTAFSLFFLFLTIDELHLADLVWSTNHGAFRGLYRFLTVNSFDLERLVYGIVTSAKNGKVF